MGLSSQRNQLLYTATDPATGLNENTQLYIDSLTLSYFLDSGFLILLEVHQSASSSNNVDNVYTEKGSGLSVFYTY